MQTGRILFYNPQTGIGKLILESKEKMDFSVDVWDDFELTPEVGVLVRCFIENGVLKSIKALQESVPILKADFQESDVLVALPFVQDETDTRVREALHSYFSPIRNVIGEPPDVVNTKAQLDYFLSKRFLLTSYNNLRNFDASLYEHKDITALLETIDSLHKAYNNAGEKIDLPLIAFETIFLRAQPEYIKYKDDKSRCDDRINVLIIVENSLLSEVRKKEAEVKKLSKGDRKQNKLESELKYMTWEYIDALDEKALLIKELDSLINIKALYTEKYYDSFLRNFNILSSEYKTTISKILNYKAYELDEIIWKNAGKSKLIKDYFISAGIEGNYSTLTYLRYYIRTLDKKNLKTEQKDLLKLLKYLEKENK